MQVSAQTLKKHLRNLAIELTAHNPDINFGGCGVMAAMVGKELQNVGVKVDIVTPAYDSDNVPSNVRKRVNENTVDDWDDNGLLRGHLAVRFRLGSRLWTWDSDGLQLGGSTFGKGRRDHSKYNFGKGLTVQECKILAGRKTGWSSIFNRKDIPALRRIVKKHFKELKNESLAFPCCLRTDTR